MPSIKKRTNGVAEEPETVLLKAATTIGRAAGKLVGLVSRKSAEGPARKKRRTKPKVVKTQTSMRKAAVRKKTSPSRKKKGAVKSISRPGTA